MYSGFFNFFDPTDFYLKRCMISNQVSTFHMVFVVGCGIQFVFVMNCIPQLKNKQSGCGLKHYDDIRNTYRLRSEQKTQQRSDIELGKSGNPPCSDTNGYITHVSSDRAIDPVIIHARRQPSNRGSRDNVLNVPALFICLFIMLLSFYNAKENSECTYFSFQ